MMLPQSPVFLSSHSLLAPNWKSLEVVEVVVEQDNPCKVTLSRTGIGFEATVNLIRQITRKQSISEGKFIHARIVKSSSDGIRFLGNLLLQMYGRCGAFEYACMVFNLVPERNIVSWNIMFTIFVQNRSLQQACDLFAKMPDKNVISWNSMIAAYVQHGRRCQALEVLRQMDVGYLEPNRVTYITLLQACGNSMQLTEGKCIHARILGCRLESDIVLETAILNMYGKCGSIEEAQSLFNKMPERNVVSWTALILAYGQNGQQKSALIIFQMMKQEGVLPNKVTIVSILDTCVTAENQALGKWLHAYIKNSEQDVILGSSLINMYGKHGDLVAATTIFNCIPVRNVVSWNTMIKICAQLGHGDGALQYFYHICLDGLVPDKVTFIGILDACDKQAFIADGKYVHALVLSNGFWMDTDVGNAILNIYYRCASLKEAEMVFNTLLRHDVISYTVMISAYSQYNYDREVLQAFQKMQLEGVEPNNVTVVNLLESCASQADLALGKYVHTYVINKNFEPDDAVATTLVNMYSRCGCLEDAQLVFQKLHNWHVVSWTCIIAAYAQHGQGKKALNCFKQMQLQGTSPNSTTFISILYACSMAGLVDEVFYYLITLSWDHNIVPGLEHYNCLIYQLARTGQLNQAEDLVNNMVPEPEVTSQMILLDACSHVNYTA